jgi:hypothetical protein
MEPCITLKAQCKKEKRKTTACTASNGVNRSGMNNKTTTLTQKPAGERESQHWLGMNNSSREGSELRSMYLYKPTTDHRPDEPVMSTTGPEVKQGRALPQGSNPSWEYN